MKLSDDRSRDRGPMRKRPKAKRKPRHALRAQEAHHLHRGTAAPPPADRRRLYFTGMLDRFIGAKSEAQEEKAAPPKQTVFYDLPELLVNLNGAGRKASFLKMSISLELESQIDVARLQSVMPRIIDNFQVYLRELAHRDLRGSGGMYRLREELLLRVNAAAAPAKIVDVLFKEMLVQ